MFCHSSCSCSGFVLDLNMVIYYYCHYNSHHYYIVSSLSLSLVDLRRIFLAVLLGHRLFGALFSV